MIDLYSGTPGSGKSLHVAADIRTRLQRKGTVTIGNFYIDTGSVKNCRGSYLYVDNSRLLPDRLRQFSHKLGAHLGRRIKEDEIWLVIDEAQLLFNSREWQTSFGRKEWLSFFTQHRHYGFHVVLLAQFDRMLDRQIRGVIENDYVHRKISRAGKIGAVLGFLTGGSLFMYIKKWYPINQKIDSQFFMGNKKLYALYDSYNHFDMIDAIPSKKMVRTKSG